MRLYLVISFFFLPLISISQNGKIDSLKKTLVSLHDTSRVDCLNQIGILYFQIYNQDSVESYTKKAYDESTSLQYAHGIAVSLILKSAIYFQFYSDFGYAETLARESLSWFGKTSNKNDIELAEDALSDALFPQSKYDECYLYDIKKYDESLKKNSGEGMFDALTGMGVIHFQKGNYDSSFYFFMQAQQLAEKIHNEILANNLLFNLGTLYRAIEDYPTASNCYRQAFQNDDSVSIASRKTENWDVWVKMEYAELFGLQHQFDSAWYYYNQFDTTKIDQKILRVYLVSTGETYFLQKKYHQALQNFLRGLVIHKKLKDYNEVKRTLLDIARIYLNLNDNEAALRYAHEGLDLSIQTKSRQFIRDAYQILYSVYDRMSIRDTAYYYYRQYITMKDAVTSDQTKGRLAAHTYDEKIELLRKEQQIGQEQLTLRNQQLKHESLIRNILIGGFLLILLFGFIIFRNFILKNKNEKLQHERAQAELRHQTSELEMQALRAQMNPHFIFNCLNSINSFILNNETESASDYLTKFSRLIRMVLVNSKHKLISLEDELDMLKLYLGMERLRSKNSFDYDIIMVNSVDAGDIFIPPLLLQPFAENAIWHGLLNKVKGEKGRLEIAFSLEEDMLICKITDNGIGRKAAEELKSRSLGKQKSMGLKITKARLESSIINPDRNTFFEFEDLYDVEGKAAGTRVIIRINTKETARSQV